MSRTDRLNPPAPIPEVIRTLSGNVYPVKDLLEQVGRSHVVNLQTGRSITRKPKKATSDASYRGRVPEFTIEDRRELVKLTPEEIMTLYGLTAQQARNLRSNSLKCIETYEIRQQLKTGTLDEKTTARLLSHGIGQKK